MLYIRRNCIVCQRKHQLYFGICYSKMVFRWRIKSLHTDKIQVNKIVKWINRVRQVNNERKGYNVYLNLEQCVFFSLFNKISHFFTSSSSISFVLNINGVIKENFAWSYPHCLFPVIVFHSTLSVSQSVTLCLIS